MGFHGDLMMILMGFNYPVVREGWGTLGIHILPEVPVFSDVCHHALS